MFSCANYPRGCRGRVNVKDGKCSNCLSLNLRRPAASSSPFSSGQNYRKPWDAEKPTDTRTTDRA